MELKAIILGIIEGLTEFLPISSTAHLIIGARLMSLPQSAYWKFFEVFIQSGAILAVVGLYFKKLWSWQTIKNLLFSFVPTSIVGLVLYKIIKNVFFESFNLILLMLFVVGVLFLVVEKLVSRKKLLLTKELAQMRWQEAVLIGLIQALAVVPGVSRAGAIIVGMMFLKYKREDSALYSFMLAVPTILAASALDVLKTDSALLFQNLNLSILGLGVSFLAALVVIRWFINFLQKNGLLFFGYYRIVLSIILFLAVYFKVL